MASWFLQSINSPQNNANSEMKLKYIKSVNRRNYSEKQVEQARVGGVGAGIISKAGKVQLSARMRSCPDNKYLWRLSAEVLQVLC